MRSLPQPHLTTSPRTQRAVELLQAQGNYGAMTRVASAHGVSRPTAYAHQRRALAALNAHYEAVADWGVLATVGVDERLIERFIVSQYVVGHSTIRGIEDVLPITYPGVVVSYGKIQAILTKAQQKAVLFNAGVKLDAIDAAALDEMFSQGNPVLAAVDLKSGYLINLAIEHHRDGKTWAAFLESAKKQGLHLDVVVKDAALGIASGVKSAFPDAEQRDDMFHAIYEMGKVLYRLERRAYGAIKAVDSAKEARKKVKQRRYTADPAKGIKARRSAGAKVGVAVKYCNKVLIQHDAFECAMTSAVQAMQIVDLRTGWLSTEEQALIEITKAGDAMLKLKNPKAKKVGRYIKNRAPGLTLYIRDLHQRFLTLADEYRLVPVSLAVTMWQLKDDLQHKRRPWDTRLMKSQLAGAGALLHRMLDDTNDPERFASLHTAVRMIMDERYRSSSAIEGFNAALRPFLYLHKGVTQGFLDLFRAHHNLKTRRWGRHKGTSAYECITGTKVHDWLSLLGYPPSELTLPTGAAVH